VLTGTLPEMTTGIATGRASVESAATPMLSPVRQSKAQERNSGQGKSGWETKRVDPGRQAGRQAGRHRKKNEIWSTPHLDIGFHVPFGCAAAPPPRVHVGLRRRDWFHYFSINFFCSEGERSVREYMCEGKYREAMGKLTWVAAFSNDARSRSPPLFGEVAAEKQN
jgi:hypothetical protein